MSRNSWAWSGSASSASRLAQSRDHPPARCQDAVLGSRCQIHKCNLGFCKFIDHRCDQVAVNLNVSLNNTSILREATHVGKGVGRHHGWLPWLQQIGMLKKSSLPGSIPLGMGNAKYKVRPFRFAKCHLAQLCAMRPALETLRAVPPRTCTEWMSCHARMLQAFTQQTASKRPSARAARKLARAGSIRSARTRPVTNTGAKDSGRPTYKVQWAIRSLLLPVPKLRARSPRFCDSF